MEKLSEIANITSGYTFRSAIVYSDFGMPVIQAKDVGNYIVHENSLPLVNIDPPSSSHVETGDIVLASRGHFRAAQYLAETDQVAVAASSLYVLKITNSKISGEFLMLYLNSQTAQSYLANLSTGSSIKTISMSELKKLKVPILAPTEQENLVKLHKNAKQQNELAQHRIQLVDAICNSAFNKTVKGAV